VTYCDPEIASVGLTEKQATEQYGEVETYEYNLAGNGRSKILNTTGWSSSSGRRTGRSSECT
jgi:dihydrolipoamide dehydrogenase